MAIDYTRDITRVVGVNGRGFHRFEVYRTTDHEAARQAFYRQFGPSAAIHYVDMVALVNRDLAKPVA